MKFRDRRGLSPEEDRALDMWEHCLKGLGRPDLPVARVRLGGQYRLVEQMRARHGSLSTPKVAMIDLMYHDVDRSRGLFYKLRGS